MAPPAADVDIATPVQPVPVDSAKLQAASAPATAPSHSSASRLAGPLKYSGTLDSYEHFDTTAVIGREYPTLQLSEILHDDDKIRDLAVQGKCSDLTT